MAELVPNASLVLNNIPAVFPRQTEPAASHTTFLTNQNDGNTDDLQNFRVDPTAKCAYPCPLFVPHDNVVYGDPYGSAGLPTVVYTASVTDAATTISENTVSPWGFKELQVVHVTDPGSGGTPENEATLFASAPLDGHINELAQGVAFFWKRKVANAGNISAPNLNFRFKIVSNGVTYLFSISTGVGLNPQVGVSVDGGVSYKVISSLAKPDADTVAILGNTGVEDSDRYVGFEVLFVNFTVQIFIAGSTTPLVFPFFAWEGDELPVITEIQFQATHFTELRLSAHITKWGVESNMVSALQNLGYSPVLAPTYRLHGLTSAVRRASGVPWAVSFPGGSSVTATRAPGILGTDPNQAYILTVRNPAGGFYMGQPYAHLTAAATRVAIVTGGVWIGTDSSWNNPENLTSFGHGLKEIREEINFDLNTLGISQNVSFTLDNFYGGSTLNGDRSGLQGNKAVNLQWGYLSPAISLQQRFVGIVQRYEYYRPGDNKAFVRCHATDLTLLLKKKQVFAAPDLDGWNHYSAVAVLIQIAGITVSQMDASFRALVPTESGGTLLTDPNGVIEPFAAAGADPAPYFLPLGIGMNPWTPRNRAMTVWDLLQHVRTATGFMIYFNAGGYFRYHAWIPAAAGGVVKVFTEGATGPDGADLSEFWDPVIVSSTEDVRNQVITIGVDAYGGSWNPIVTKLEDGPSINTPTAANYLGFASPFVWADSKFANQGFATEATARMFNFMRVPEYSGDWECWLQPGMFPMTVVQLQEVKSGIYTLPLYITRMVNTYTAIDGSLRFRSQISARYITPFV